MKTKVIEKSSIGIKENGVIKVITVEEDCNPAFAGATLYAKFQSKEKVRKLIALGDLYLLRENLKPSTNCLHYVLKKQVRKGKVVSEICIQEHVCVVKSRDLKCMDSQGVIKPIKAGSKCRTYNFPLEVYWGEGTSKLYLFDGETEKWETWGIPYESEYFMPLKIGYMNLIKNMVYRRDITPLTESERENLNYIT